MKNNLLCCSGIMFQKTDKRKLDGMREKRIASSNNKQQTTKHIFEFLKCVIINNAVCVYKKRFVFGLELGLGLKLTGSTF